MAHGERTARVRELARNDPTLTQADIARILGFSRQVVWYALRTPASQLTDGRRGRRPCQQRASAIEEARRKMQAGEPISREERHLLQEDYRRREREARA